MPLFEGEKATEVVSAQDIRDLTGVRETDFIFDAERDPKEALNKMLETWINRIASHIFIRLERKVNTEDGEFYAIQDVLIRTVANLVAIAQQQRSTPIIQIDNFAVNILNTSEVTSELEEELKPFKRYKKGKNSGWVSIFSSLEPFEGDK